MKLKALIPGLVIAGLAVGAVIIFRKNTVSQDMVPQTGVRVKGPENAKVVIVEYSDFQCPACQRAQATLNQFLKDYPQDVQLIYRHFPLRMHMWAPLAHQASECALDQGKFWEYHDELYATQAQWSGPAHPSEHFFTIAKKIGLNLDPFAACLSSGELDADIMEDRKKGDEVQIASTPTFFINGERLVGPMELYVKGEKIIRQVLGLPAKPDPIIPQLPQGAPAAPAAGIAPAQGEALMTPLNPAPQESAKS